MKTLRFPLAVSLYFVAMSSASAFSITGAAIGVQNFQHQSGAYQNGDFHVQPCCGEPMVGYAQKAWISWTYDFTMADEFPALRHATSLTTARLDLKFSTRGNAPGDDVIFGSIPLAAVFDFAQPHTFYEITLDLLALGGQQSLLDGLNTGKLTFNMGDDSAPYFAVLQVEGVPEPDIIFLAIAGIGITMAKVKFRRIENFDGRNN